MLVLAQIGQAKRQLSHNRSPGKQTMFFFLVSQLNPFDTGSFLTTQKKQKLQYINKAQNEGHSNLLIKLEFAFAFESGI